MDNRKLIALVLVAFAIFFLIQNSQSPQDQKKVPHPNVTPQPVNPVSPVKPNPPPAPKPSPR
jgi:large-conductance mechanosensitive channel